MNYSLFTAEGNIKLGIVADDNTGATDAAGMLTERGVRTLLCMDMPNGKAAPEAFDAVVIGTGTRSLAPKEAFDRTSKAVEWLRSHGAEKIQVKYCSTFDSTPQGNIGQSLDAAMEALNAEGCPVSPALPIHGRTTYMGYHFVRGELLSESPLRDHPLNPMTDANLVRWLSGQTARRVGLVPLSDIRGGASRLKKILASRLTAGENYLVTDALEEADLSAIARATADWPLVSGGSGLTAEIPRYLFPKRGPVAFPGDSKKIPGPLLVLAGSCSPATRGQNAFALADGFWGHSLDGLEILRETLDADQVAERAAADLTMGRNVLIYTSADPQSVEKTQAFGRMAGLTPAQTGERIAKVLAGLGAKLMEKVPVRRLLISGGETSAAVCRLLELRHLETGLPIEPGVPECYSLDRPGLTVILKSGNFGSREFYHKALGHR